MNSRPGGMCGLHHVALWVEQFDECVHFYTDLLGLQVEWQPDQDNIYLSSGSDNLALHRCKRTPQNGQQTEALSEQQQSNKNGHLDHIGFILAEIDDVNRWFDFLVNQNIPIKAKPKDHRDGARSFYCYDPDGILVQFIYHPPLSIS